MRVQLLDEAEQDLIDGYRFFEAQDEDLGDYFLDSLYSDIDSLQLSLAFIQSTLVIIVHCLRDFPLPFTTASKPEAFESMQY